MLADILAVDGVQAPLKVGDKKALFGKLGALGASAYGLRADRVTRALLGREQLGATGVGRGVAIPHARLPEAGRIEGLFVRLERPIHYGAHDRRPVDLVFALLGPDVPAAHLRALAAISRTLRDEAVRRKLRSTFDPQALHAILVGDALEAPIEQRLDEAVGS
jgi:nitrogen PTS system EIIA component